VNIKLLFNLIFSSVFILELMANFLTYYKKYNPNLYSLLVSLLLALWYNGISGMLNYYWPTRGPYISVVFLLLPIILFLTDDGHLDELYKPPGIAYPINQTTNVSAMMAAATPDTSFRTNGINQAAIRREKFRI